MIRWYTIRFVVVPFLLPISVLSSRNVDRESRSVSSLSDDAAIKESAIRHCRVGRSIKLYEPLDGQLRDPIHHNAYARKA